MLSVVKIAKAQKVLSGLLIFAILGLTTTAVYLNTQEQKAIDRTRLPAKLELSNGFQRWLTNLKNKDFEIEADEFELIEENEIYNTRWLKISSIEEPGAKEAFEAQIKAKTVAEDKPLRHVVFSPSEREFIDYRNVERDGYKANEVRFYGLRDDKIFDLRAVDCSTQINCYFDRAFFIDNSNDVFAITEFSRKVYADTIDNENATELTACTINELCTYTIKVHLIDLVNNSRLVYESKPFDIVLTEKIPEL